MAKKPKNKPNDEYKKLIIHLATFDEQHRQNLTKRAKKVEELYQKAIKSIAQAAQPKLSLMDDKSKDFYFSDFPTLNKATDNFIQELANSLQMNLEQGTEEAWTLANTKYDYLVDTLTAGYGLKKEILNKWKHPHLEALKAFEDRRRKGMNLSNGGTAKDFKKGVWNLDQFKTELELALEQGIGQGKSAAQLSREIRQYLKEPQKLFRRVRNEKGALRLSKAAAAYHPGQGMYRSSYKNALRLTATENNIAYRTADYERIQHLPYILGIETHLSNNHPVVDICDTFDGAKFPKDFKFTGWHPWCRCYTTTILASEDEIDDYITKSALGEDVSNYPFKGRITTPPQQFKGWVTDNKQRIINAIKMPYFLKDNPHHLQMAGYKIPKAQLKLFDTNKANNTKTNTTTTSTEPPTAPKNGINGDVKGTKLGRSANKEAYKIYENMPAPTLTKEVKNNTKEIAKLMGIKTPPKPMTFLEANLGRSNVDFKTSKAFRENCQSCVAVHEARLRGLNVTALGYEKNKNSISYMLGERFQDIWENPKTHKTPSPTILRDKSFDKMLAKVDTATKPVGRYHIGINMEDGGHAITAERLTDGQLLFYDPQNGVSLALEEYNSSNVEYLEVLKVDKLLIRIDLFKAISRVL